MFINYNCIFSDCGCIIGDHTLIGPQVGIYAVNHPLDAVGRATGVETGISVAIGADCWIGGHATIDSGVILGNRVIVASGAVVTHSFPDDVLISGVPARILHSS